MGGRILGKSQFYIKLSIPNLKNKPVFIKSISTGETQQTGDNVAKIIKEVIAMVGVNKVTAVITNITANMRAAWDILEAEYPHIFCNGLLLMFLTYLSKISVILMLEVAY